jgi:hypothetical protein
LGFWCEQLYRLSALFACFLGEPASFHMSVSLRQPRTALRSILNHSCAAAESRAHGRRGMCVLHRWVFSTIDWRLAAPL